MRKIAILLTTLLILLSVSGPASASGGLAPFPGTSGGAGDGAPVTTILGYVLTCSSLTVAGQTGSGHVVIDISPRLYPVSLFNVAASNGFYETTVNFSPLLTGSDIDIEIWGETNASVGENTPDWDGHGWSEVDYEACPASWGSLTLPNQGVTWFNPGDGRIDGQPGDRIAVWCNTTATPPNLVVYGVGDNTTNGSHGFWLATFNNADLLKAGKAGITKNAGAGNGSISAMNDGNGNFWVAWNGGLFNATGNPPFAKSFSCQF